MSTRIAVLVAGLAAVLALAPAEASARGGHWHGGGGHRGGFGVFIGPPFPGFRPYGYGYGYRRPYYGYGRPYAFLPPPAYYVPPPAYYAPPPYYAVPPPYYAPRAYFGTPLGGYLPPSGRDGGYKR